MFRFLHSYSAQDRLYAFLGLALMLIGLFGGISDAFAHGVTVGDKGYIQETTGVHPIPFPYLGSYARKWCMGLAGQLILA